VSSDQVIRLISAVGGLLAVLVWPAVVLFFLVRFRHADGNKTPFVIYASSRAPEHVREALQHGAIGCTNSPQELVEITTRALTERR